MAYLISEWSQSDFKPFFEINVTLIVGCLCLKTKFNFQIIWRCENHFIHSSGIEKYSFVQSSSLLRIPRFSNACTVKPVYNDHPRDPEFVAVVERWSLFNGSFIL